MADVIHIKARLDKIAEYVGRVRDSARLAMPQATDVVWANVVDLTPRNKGPLQQSIKKKVVNDEGIIWSEGGVVAAVMEGRPVATWKKFPPHRAILDWVESKLGISGNEAVIVAYKIRAKIKKRGIQIPLKHDQRGGMFHRTVEKAEKTKFHIVAFVSALKQLASQAQIEFGSSPEIR